MTLAELAGYWNDLRNAALGRGTQPLVSETLANKVWAEWGAWRAYYESAGPLADVATSVSASEWVDRYRALLAAVRAEGKEPVTVLTETVYERAADTLSGALKLAAAVGAVVVLAPLAHWLWRKSS